MKKIKNTTLLYNNGGLLSDLQHNALAAVIYFVTYTTKRARDASTVVLEARKEAAIIPYYSSSLDFFSTL